MQGVNARQAEDGYGECAGAAHHQLPDPEEALPVISIPGSVTN